MPEKVYPTKEVVEGTISAYAEAIRKNPESEIEGGSFITKTLRENATFQSLVRAGEIETVMGGPKSVSGNLQAISEVAFEMGVLAGLAAAGARDVNEPLRYETEEPVDAPVEAEVA